MNYVPKIVPVQSSRVVAVVKFVDCTEVGTEHFSWTTIGVREALDSAEAFATFDNQEARIVLTGTTRGAYIVRSVSVAPQLRSGPFDDRAAVLERCLKDQLTGRAK